MESGQAPHWRRWAPLLMLLAFAGAYYALFYFPPRLTGASEPDRYYHLALARLVAETGTPRTLPQVEDLGWQRYFPDKEYLFHVFTGLGWRIGGTGGVMMLVPAFALAILACLQLTLARVISPARAAAIVALGWFLTAAFVFRLTLLRPHLLAILCFCLLLAGLLRNRPWLAAIGAAGFALAYHAWYIPLLALAIAACVPWREGGRRRWLLPAAALGAAVIVNPYFPGTLVVGALPLQLAIGIGVPPDWRGGAELQPQGALEFLAFFGAFPLLLLACAWLLHRWRAREPEMHASRLFLFALTTALVLMGVRSARAMEYAVPAAILLAGYAAALLSTRTPLLLGASLLIAIQGYSALEYYRDIWSRPQLGDSPLYLSAIAGIPRSIPGAKVFNCEWEAGSYLLYARPDLRFVDLLDPGLLWQASREKYLARNLLLRGGDPHPRNTLRKSFDADFVLCAKPGLNRQMRALPADFDALPVVGGAPLELYRVR